MQGLKDFLKLIYSKIKGKPSGNSNLHIEWGSLINVAKEQGGRITSLQTVHSLRQHTDFNLAFFI